MEGQEQHSVPVMKVDPEPETDGLKTEPDDSSYECHLICTLQEAYPPVSIAQRQQEQSLSKSVGDSVSKTPTDKEKQSRQIKQYFTSAETAVLIEEVHKHRALLLRKDQRSFFVKQKQKIWAQIAQRLVRECGSGVKRTMGEVQKKWANMKMAALHEKRAQEEAKTISCDMFPKLTPLTKKVLAVLKGSVHDESESEEEDPNCDPSHGSSPGGYESISLLHHSYYAQPPSRAVSCTVKPEEERMPDFSDVEVMCLLSEIQKYHKELSTANSAQKDTLKEQQWQTVADKINASCDEDVVRTWEDVRRKFRLLRLAAKANREQTKSDSRDKQQESQEEKLQYEYTQLVLNILDGIACVYENPVEGEKKSDQGQRSNKPEQSASTEKCLQEESGHVAAALSSGECECLVHELERFLCILFCPPVSSRGPVLQQTQTQVWGMIAEKINRCSGARWTARTLKEKWSELQKESEGYQRASSHGDAAILEPTHHNVVSAFLGRLNSVRSESGFDASAGKGNESGHWDRVTVHSYWPMRSASTPGSNKSATDNGNVNSVSDFDLKVKENSELDSEREHHVGESNGFQDNVEGVVNISAEDADQRGESLTTRLTSSTQPQPWGKRPVFSEVELKIILNIYQKNKAVLNSKKMDKRTHLNKQLVWQRITDKLNNSAEPGAPVRSAQQVRRKMTDIQTIVNGCVQCRKNPSKKRPRWMSKAMLQNLINLLDIKVPASKLSAICKEPEQNKSKAENEKNTWNKATKKTMIDRETSADILQRLDLLLQTCTELQDLGVDAGAVVFEEGTVLTCGAEQLTHPPSLQNLATLLSEQWQRNFSTEEQESRQGTADGWNVVTLGNTLFSSPANTGVVHAKSKNSMVTQNEVHRGGRREKTVGVELSELTAGNYNNMQGEQAQDIKRRLENDEWGSFFCTECQASFSCLSLFFLHKQDHTTEQEDGGSGQKEIKMKHMAQENTTVLMESPAEMTHHDDYDDEIPEVEDSIPENSADISSTGNNQPIEQKVPKKTRQKTDNRALHKNRNYCFACKYCGKTFFNRNNRAHHERIHTNHGEKPYECPVCNGRFYNGADMKAHMRLLHSGDGTYACDLCDTDSVFVKAFDLLLHRKQQHGCIGAKKLFMTDRYKCEYCGKRLSSASKLKVHKRHHTGDKPYTCEVCNKGYTSNSSLQQHQQRHFNPMGFQCEICGAKFTGKGSLKVHMRLHTGERPFKCDLCEAAFVSSYACKVHRRKHTGERPYLCDLCGESFIQSDKLVCHRRIHTGEKPYQCEDCGEKFSQTGTLNIHRRKHTGIQPYTCSVCKKHFQAGNHLKIHMRLHTGEKPYECETCGKAFPRRDMLRAHKRRHGLPAQTDSRQAKRSNPGRITVIAETGPTLQDNSLWGTALDLW